MYSDLKARAIKGQFSNGPRSVNPELHSLSYGCPVDTNFLALNTCCSIIVQVVTGSLRY